jgi:hypothetical protein
MPNDATGPSSFSLWLEEALTGWLLPVAALAIVVATGILYYAGIVSEAAAGGLVCVAAPLLAAVLMLRPLVESGRDRAGKVLVAAAAGATLLAGAAPALRSIVPGEPLFRGDVGVEGETIPVPAGAHGNVRVLVHGKLGQGGEPSVSFTLAGSEPAIEGRLERTVGYARVGRGGRARVAHDHTADWFEGALPPGAVALRLARLQGQLGGRLEVAVYRQWLPRAWLWAVAAAALLLAAAADARLGLKGNSAVPSGMALAFGLLVAYNATPFSAAGPAVGGVVLGAMVGALAGAIAGVIGRKLVPHARRRAPERSGRDAAA